MSSVLAKTITSANVALTSVQVAPVNENRRAFMIYNNSSNSCYINFGVTASSSACSIIIPSFQAWSWPFIHSYSGTINAIRNAGSGTIIITEFISLYSS